MNSKTFFSAFGVCTYYTIYGYILHFVHKLNVCISEILPGKDLDAAMEEYNAQALDDFNKKSLLECKNCGRTFLPKPLEIHSRSCKPGQEK